MSAPEVFISSCGESVLPRGLRHLLLALLVEDEAVGQHHVERRAAARAAALQQRGLEPAAVLVGAFQVHHAVLAAVALAADAGELREGLRVLQREGVRGAGVEPHVEDVGRPSPSRRGCRRGPARKRSCAPASNQASAPFSAMAARMRAISSSDLANLADGITSPVSLCWKTVIGTPQARWREITQSGLRLDHAAQAVLARGRHELGLGDGLQRQLAQGPVAAHTRARIPLPLVGRG